VLVGTTAERLKELIIQRCSEIDAEIIEMEIMVGIGPEERSSSSASPHRSSPCGVTAAGSSVGSFTP